MVYWCILCATWKPIVTEWPDGYRLWMDARGSIKWRTWISPRHALSQVEIDLHIYTYLLRRPRILQAETAERGIVGQSMKLLINTHGAMCTWIVCVWSVVWTESCPYVSVHAAKNNACKQSGFREFARAGFCLLSGAYITIIRSLWI